MSNWTGRLKLKMKELDLTQEELAKKLGVTRSAVAHYVQGTRQPPLKQVIKLANIFKTDPAWLQFGEYQKSVTSTASNIKQKSNRIPILDWQQVKNLPYDLTKEKYEYIEYFNCHQNDCYALKIKGDAMVSTMNQRTSFDPGSYVIVDPHKLPTHGSYVIATTSNKNEAILRQYIEEGGTLYLKPFNPQYPLIELEKQTKIWGVVIANIQLV